MILASDLDRTMIHPLRHAPEGREDEWMVAEIYEGRPITCIGHATLRLIDELDAGGLFLPVTTRSREQLLRITPIAADARPWAVCANGGIVLRHGTPDPEWTRTVARDAAGAGTLAEVVAAVDAAVGAAAPDHWRLRERDCEALFLYSVCDLDRTPQGAEDAVRDAVAPLGWTAHLHGRKLYVLPSGLTKARAVAYVRERAGVDGDLHGAGDSELDRCLLEIGTVGHVPRGSELDLGSRPLPPQAVVTQATGIDASEEILRAVLAPA